MPKPKKEKEIVYTGIPDSYFINQMDEPLEWFEDEMLVTQEG